MCKTLFVSHFFIDSTFFIAMGKNSGSLVMRLKSQILLKIAIKHIDI